jgi:2,4-dienoyl-CoA reductase-like NADH-dependent reductase (Old Yellow Enzyme family)
MSTPSPSHAVQQVVPMDSPQPESRLSSDITTALLGAPLQLGPYQLPHRMLMASMTRSRCLNLLPSDLHEQYYSARAGAGLIFSEHFLIEPQGSEWILAPLMNSAAAATAWKSVTDRVHSKGARMFAQLWHGGRCMHPLHQGGLPAVGPSAIKAAGGRFRLLQAYIPTTVRKNKAGAADEQHTPPHIGFTAPVAIECPRHYVNLFATAASFAKDAGFDGVELHSASGFLPHQFLDTSANSRTDEWGGSVENRCRFVLEVIDALIAVWGAQRVGIKLAPCGGYNDVGMPLEETRRTYTYLLNQLRDRGLAYVQVQRYTADMDGERGTKFDVRELKQHFAHATGRFILNGDYNAEEAAKAVKNGDCDAVTFASYYLTNPDLAQRVLKGQRINAPDYTNLYGDFFRPETFPVGYTDQLSFEQEEKMEKKQQQQLHTA